MSKVQVGETPEEKPSRWEEWEENVKYTIDVEIDKEEPWYIKRIEMREIEYHDGNSVSEVIIVSIKDGDYYVEKYRVRDNWGGTGREDILSLRFNDYSETLSIFYYDEIAEVINNYGVRKAIQYVKSFIIDAITIPLANVICELEKD